MDAEPIKYWEITRGNARVDVYAFDVYDDAFYVAKKKDAPSEEFWREISTRIFYSGLNDLELKKDGAPSVALARELEEAETDNRPDIVDYRDARGYYGNEYPDARAVVEYLLENNLIEVDAAKYVGPEFDPTIPARCDELIF